MIYIIFLFGFNILIMVILSMVETSSNRRISDRIFGYKLDKPFLMNNTDKRINEIKINSYHSIYIKDTVSTEDKSNE